MLQLGLKLVLQVELKLMLQVEELRLVFVEQFDTKNLVVMLLSCYKKFDKFVILICQCCLNLMDSSAFSKPAIIRVQVYALLQLYNCVRKLGKVFLDEYFLFFRLMVMLRKVCLVLI